MQWRAKALHCPAASLPLGTSALQQHQHLPLRLLVRHNGLPTAEVCETLWIAKQHLDELLFCSAILFFWFMPYDPSHAHFKNTAAFQLMTFKSGRVKTVHHSVHHMHLLFHIVWQDCGNQQLYCAMAVCIFLYTCMLSGLVRELPRKSNSHQKLWRLDKDLVWQMWCCSQQVTLVEIYQNALFLYINLGFRV